MPIKLLPKNITTLILLIVWLTMVTTAIVLAFGLYVGTQIQPLPVTSESQRSTTQESTVMDQVKQSGVAEPTETEIIDDTDLQGALNELEAADIDDIDALLEQNDRDAAAF